MKIYKVIDVVPHSDHTGGGQPRLLARFSAFSGKTLEPPAWRFRWIAAGIMLLISLMKCFLRISRRRMSPVLVMECLSSVCLASFGWTACCHAHPQDLMQKSGAAVAKIDQAHSHSPLGISRTSRKDCHLCHGEQQPGAGIGIAWP